MSMSTSASTSMSGKCCVALRGKKKTKLKKNEWERLCGLGGEEKDGTEEEGILLRTGGREPKVRLEVLADLKAS